MTNVKSLELLEKLKSVFETEIGIAVIDYIEGYGEEWYIALKDVVEHGCQSGTVGSLIYYNQTNDFHDQHEDEIDEIIENYLDMTGLSLTDVFTKFNVWEITLLKNYKAWFAFESIAGEIIDYISNELEESED